MHGHCKGNAAIYERPVARLLIRLWRRGAKTLLAIQGSEQILAPGRCAENADFVPKFVSSAREQR